MVESFRGFRGSSCCPIFSLHILPSPLSGLNSTALGWFGEWQVPSWDTEVVSGASEVPPGSIWSHPGVPPRPLSSGYIRADEEDSSRLGAICYSMINCRFREEPTD